MEEITKKKKNWSNIILWILVIILLAYSAILTKMIFKIRKGMAFNYELKSLKNNFQKLNYPIFTFAGKGGLQKLNNEIMVSVNNVEKYLNGYKIQIGILNTSSIKLSGIDLTLYKKTYKDTFWYNRSFKINKDLNVATLIHETIILEDTTEEELTSMNWSMEASATSYYYKSEK